MHFSNWLIFCGVALVVTFTPGPGVLLAVSNSVTLGLRLTAICSLGVALGLFIVSGIAMAGMGVVLAASAAAFTTLKLVGAIYLIYLGIKQWRNSVHALSDVRASPATLGRAHAAWRLFSQGLTVALTNPKAILFFSALFPQFMTREEPALGQFVLLTTTFVACALLSHAFYILLARVLKYHFASPRRLFLFNRASGVMFVVLGLSLLGLRNKAT